MFAKSKIAWNDRISKRYNLLNGYYLREFALSFLASFLFFFAVFFFNQVLLLARTILAERVPFLSVLLLLIYAVPTMISLSFPFATLAGALMTSGKLTSDNEILASMASGVPGSKAFIIIAIVALGISGFSYTINDYFLPRGYIAFTKLWQKVIINSPSLILKPYSIKRYQNITIVTGAMSGSIIQNIVIFDKSNSNESKVITAKEAQILSGSGDRDIILQLVEVWQQTVTLNKTDRFEWSKADKMEYAIRLRNPGAEYAGLAPNTLPSSELKKLIITKQTALHQKLLQHKGDLRTLQLNLSRIYTGLVQNMKPWQTAMQEINYSLTLVKNSQNQIPEDRSLKISQMEYYKKFSLSLSSLVFVLFAFPIGLFARRSGRIVGFGLGILVSTIYWALQWTAEISVLRIGLSPIWSMWLPNLIIIFAAALAWISVKVKKNL